MNLIRDNWPDTTLLKQPLHIYSIAHVTVRESAFYSFQNYGFNLIAERKQGESRG